jgi:DNA-directed RNA polymerase subunit RPC12/RpoP
VRSTGIAYLLWFFLGYLGVHRFYCGRVWSGVLWFLTLGLFGIGWIIDAFLIPGMVEESNRDHLSYQRAFPRNQTDQSFDRGGETTPPPPPQPPLARAPADAKPASRVLYCSQCGKPMRVPDDSDGMSVGCPTCRAVVRVPNRHTANPA